MHGSPIASHCIKEYRKVITHDLNEIQYVLCLTQRPFILFFLLFATSFGLNRPSSDQYLQKLKNAGAYSMTRQFHYAIHIHYCSL